MEAGKKRESFDSARRGEILKKFRVEKREKDNAGRKLAKSKVPG